jgi:hypothetical protein
LKLLRDALHCIAEWHLMAPNVISVAALTSASGGIADIAGDVLFCGRCSRRDR